MNLQTLRALAIAGALAASGCAHVPRDAGRADVDALLDARLGMSPPRADDAAWIDAALAATLSRDDAVRVALAQSPRVQSAYARLRLSHADVLDAGRLANPRLSLSFLEGGGVKQITRGIVVPFADLLMLPARTRLAAGEFEAARHDIVAQLLALAHDTEAAWYRAVGARQAAAMRDVAADAADASAALAQRFHDAGNLPALQWQREQAAASEARLDALRARRDATRATLDLQTLLGVADGRALALPDTLPLPPPDAFDIDALSTLQDDLRGDLAARRERIATLDRALALARHWRFIGEIDLGYERETETGEARMRGPTIELAIPLFRQGLPAIARAQARRDEARADYDADVLAARNALRSALDELASTRALVDEFRARLVPARAAVVARSQESVNYMLLGTFELIAAKRDEYAAYAGYLDAVRDYWLARADLRRAVGGALPGDDATPGEAVGPPALDASAAAHGHGGHDGHTGHTGHTGHERHDEHDGHEPPAASTPGDTDASHEHPHSHQPETPR